MGRGFARPHVSLCVAPMVPLTPTDRGVALLPRTHRRPEAGRARYGRAPRVFPRFPVAAAPLGLLLLCLPPSAGRAQGPERPMRLTVVGLNGPVSNICLEYPVVTSPEQVQSDVRQMAQVGGWCVGPLLPFESPAPTAWRVEARPGVTTDSEGKPPLWPAISALRRFDELSAVFVHGVEGAMEGQPVSNVFMTITWEAHGGATYYDVRIKDPTFRSMDELPRRFERPAEGRVRTPLAVWVLLGTAALSAGLLAGVVLWLLAAARAAPPPTAGTAPTGVEGKPGTPPGTLLDRGREQAIVAAAGHAEEDQR